MATTDLVLEAAPPGNYLAGNEFVDVDDQSVRALALTLRQRAGSDVSFAKAAFEWVRDEVGHSYDVQDPRVTWLRARFSRSASDSVMPSRTCLRRCCDPKASRPGCATSVSRMETDMFCTGWSRCTSTAPGTGKIRAETRTVSTHSSHSIRNNLPGTLSPLSGKSTIRGSSRRRHRVSSKRSAARRTCCRSTTTACQPVSNASEGSTVTPDCRPFTDLPPASPPDRQPDTRISAMAA